MSPVESTETKELTSDDIYDILKEDDKVEDKKEESKKETKTEEKKEIKTEEKKDEIELTEEIKTEEIEEEIEEKPPEEEEFELVVPVRRAEILKAYPDLFKKFPYLEKAYFREQQYTELLPTLDDAKEAISKSEILDRFESDLLKGETEKILITVRNNNKKSFDKVVDNYLPTLAKVDQQAYYHIIGNVFKEAIVNMVKEGKKSEDESLETAAKVLNKFMFGTSEFIPATNLSKVDDGKESESDKLQAERESFLQEKFDNAKDNLNTRVQNVLKSTVDQNIDPKDSMTPYVKKNATREALESLESLLDKDARFQTIINRLWEKAFDSDFSKSSLDSIRSNYLAKARTLLPSVIKKSQNEALKGLGKKDDTTDRKGPLPKGRTSSDTSANKSSTTIPKGMTTREYLEME